jgi:transposase
MKPLTISDSDHIVLGLQGEIQRSDDARYDHRLHGVLLVAQGVSCREVARLLGDAPRTVQYWVHRFEEKGLAGLQEGERSGRPQRLSAEQICGINRALRQDARHVGMDVTLWDGKTLSSWIHRQYGIRLGTRQCQRLFRKLDFRLRKPRPVIAKADPARQARHKKNSGR